MWDGGWEAGDGWRGEGEMWEGQRKNRKTHIVFRSFGILRCPSSLHATCMKSPAVVHSLCADLMTDNPHTLSAFPFSSSSKPRNPAPTLAPTATALAPTLSLSPSPSPRTGSVQLERRAVAVDRSSRRRARARGRPGTALLLLLLLPPPFYQRAHPHHMACQIASLQ